LGGVRVTRYGKSGVFLLIWMGQSGARLRYIRI
jgi:hypothetical protein